MKNETKTHLAAIVDRLGVLAASASAIDAEREALKAELILAGVESVDGQLFRAAVSHCPGRVVTDWKTIATTLGALLAADVWEQIVESETTTGTPYSVVRVSARKGA